MFKETHLIIKKWREIMPPVSGATEQDVSTEQGRLRDAEGILATEQGYKDADLG